MDIALTQISRDNVSRLSLDWSMAMHAGSNQPTPLVRDGVMFLTHPHNKIQAIEAATGELIWEYQYAFPRRKNARGTHPQYCTVAGPIISGDL